MSGPAPVVRVLGGGAAKVLIACTDRHGGVSLGAFSSLNLSCGVGDEPRFVMENRRRVASCLGFDPRHLTFGVQVHGSRIRVVEEVDRGRGSGGMAGAFPDTDALATSVTGLPLTVLTADCYAVALAGSNSVAVAHAGWRGTIEDVAGACVALMCERWQEEPSRIRAWLGPGIRPCCYDVDAGRAAAFVERYGVESGVCLDNAGRHGLDLERANRLNLEAAGVMGSNIESHGGCTCCDASFFSYRRDGGVTGRQAVIVARCG
ncbi:MAG: polyphenol oxidase family protein [Candidatus Geothermincolia bacterium]